MTTLPDLADRIRHEGEIAKSLPDFPGDPPGAIGTQHYITMPSPADMLLALAEVEVLCPTSHHWGPKGRPLLCNMCDGTGVASLYPTLREPCPKPDFTQSGGNFGHFHLANQGCQGRGWVPIQQDVVERVWDEMHSQSEMLFSRFSTTVERRMLHGEPVLTATLAAAVLATAAEEKP